MKTSKQNLGKKGEDLAENFLVQRGFKIIEKNYRFNRGEIDIIGRDKENIIIAEVKSVRVQGFGTGEERISPKKQQKLIATAYGFLDEHPEFADMGVRFDVIVVNFDRYPAEIKHYPGAFWQEYK